MSCCNNKKYVDTSCVKTNEWDDVNNLLGVTDCGTVVKVKKPVHELDDQDRDKLDALTIDGSGDKVLTDEGSYKGLASLGAVMNGENEIINIHSKNHIEVTARQNISISSDEGRKVSVKELEVTDSAVTFQGEPLLKSSDIDHVVVYDENNNIQARKNIILKNGTAINGVISEGNSFRMATMSSNDQLEIGSTSVDTLIQSDTRPSVKTRDGRENRVAYLADVEAANSDLSDLSGRVDGLEEELNTKIESVQADLDDFKAETAAGFEAAEKSRGNLQIQINAVNSFLNETNEELADLTDYVEELDINTEKAFEEVNETVSGLRTDVDKNTATIEVNRINISQLREDFNNEEHFKGYYETNAEIQRIEGAQGAYAWSAETGTVWIYDGNSWVDSGIPVPDQSVTPSDSLPLVDDIAFPGTSTEYARGDHRHPTDTTRAATTDLDNYLKLAGNSQATQMSGDIWLGSQQKLRVSDSGESYVGYVTDKQEAQVVSAGVGGINLISATGAVKANNQEIALKSEVEQVADDLSSLKSEHDALLETHTGQIDRNSQDIAELKEEVEYAELFKGYFTTTAEITDLQGTRGAFAWNGQSGTVWIYNAELLTWQDSLQPIPTEGSSPYQLNPAMDGIASPGTSSEYARGNHVHPTDTSRAAAEDLQAVAGKAEKAESEIEEIKTEIADVNQQLENLETNQSNYLPLSGNPESPLSGDLRLANDVAVKYNTSENAKIYFNEDQARLNIESPTIGGINIETGEATLTWNSEPVATESQVAQQYYNREQVDNLLTPVHTGIGELQSNVSQQGTQLTELYEDYTTFKGAVNSTLQETGEEVTDVKARVETAEETLAAQSEAIDSAQGRIEANKTAISELTGKVSTHDTEISGLKNRVSTAETTIAENKENIQSNASAIETLEEKVESHKEKIADLRQEVDTHTIDIAKNQQDILSITDDLSKKQYFKGYFITYLEIQQLEGENGAYAWCGETGTVWMYNAETPSWEDSLREIPQGATNPYQGLPYMDSDVPSAGVENAYSRGDHRHPTDISRASKAEFDQLKNRVYDAEEAISDLEGATEDQSGELTELKRRVSTNEDHIEDLQEKTSTLDTDLQEAKTDVEANKEDITELKGKTQQLDTDLQEVKTDIEANKEDIEELQEKTSTLNSSIGDINVLLSTNLPQIETNKNNISGLQTDMTEVKDDILTLREMIGTLNEMLENRLNGY